MKNLGWRLEAGGWRPLTGRANLRARPARGRFLLCAAAGLGLFASIAAHALPEAEVRGTAQPKSASNPQPPASSPLSKAAPQATADSRRPTAQPSAHPFVLLAELVGSVNPGSGAHLLEAIEGARENGAEALVVRLDTPGGLLSTTRDLVQAELSSKVPVVFWVGPPGARAGSAGVFLTLAANVAAMAPSTNIGAAHPIGIGGGGGGGKKSDKGDKRGDEKSNEADDGDAMARKVENDTAAFVQGIAERRSRNVEWAEQAVRESVSITATKALQLKVIDLIAEDLPELLQKLDGRKIDLGSGDVRTLHTAGAEVRTAGWSVRNRVLHFLADPEIAYLIAMLGVLGILAELYHPGTIVPGVVGGICILIAAVSFQMLPVNAGALSLLVIGVVLLGVEFFAGGHGAFIAVGGLCIVIGSLLLIGGKGVGTAPGREFWADRDFGIGWQTVAPVCLSLVIIAFTLVSKVSRASKQKLLSGAPGLIGMVGTVREAIGASSGQGRMLVNGELWSARSPQPLPEGSRARVLSVDGLVLQVAPEEPT